MGRKVEDGDAAMDASSAPTTNEVLYPASRGARGEHVAMCRVMLAVRALSTLADRQGGGRPLLLMCMPLLAPPYPSPRAAMGALSMRRKGRVKGGGGGNGASVRPELAGLEDVCQVRVRRDTDRLSSLSA